MSESDLIDIPPADITGDNLVTAANLTASDLLQEGGLRSLLDEAGLTIDSTTNTFLDSLGNMIADGLTSGDSTEEIASLLMDLGIVDSHALMIVETECSRAQAAATMLTYAANGVGQYNWLAEDSACPDCRSNADNGPYDVPFEDMTDDNYDGGGDNPTVPEHPWCRCVYLPVILDENGDNIAPTSAEGDQSIEGR
jgi:SPP1 gp7 family putative phage head morphogenesis protein